MKSICREAGYEFVVVTEADVHSGARLSNIRALWKYGRTQIRPQHHIYCQEFFTHHPEASLGELITFFASRREDRGVVLSLLYRGVVGIDINLPINSHSPVHTLA